MAIVISGSGIDMGNNPVSNASQIDSTVINENGDNVATTSNLVGFKNYIINGGFDVWQRGSSGVSEGQSYTADMWKVWAFGATTNWFRASSADFDSYREFVGWGLKWNGNPASGQSPIEHRIESINAYKLSGKKVTLSFLAKCSANSNLSVEINSANAIDNFSAITNISSQAVNLTTTTQKFIVTFDLTTKDVRNGINLVFRPTIPANIHWIAQVQLEEGSVATPFEQRPYGLELSLCQRYLPVVEGFYAGYAATSGEVYLSVANNVMPRVKPTGILHLSGGNVYYTNTSSPITNVVLFASDWSSNTLKINPTGTPLILGQGVMVGLPKILFTGCEL